MNPNTIKASGPLKLVSRSSIINFAALLILFLTIFVVRHYYRTGQKAQHDEAPIVLKSDAKTLSALDTAGETEPQTPPPFVSSPTPDRPPETAPEMKVLGLLPPPGPSPQPRDRLRKAFVHETSVEELDSEEVRLSYIASNKQIKQVSKLPVAETPKITPPTPRERSDFIPFER